MWDVKRSFEILIMGMGIYIGIDSEGCGSSSAGHTAVK